MGKFLRIFALIISLLILVVGVAFAFIEIRSIIAGDFNLMNNTVSALFRYIFRGLFYVIFVLVTLKYIFANIRKKNVPLFSILLPISLLAGSLISIAFYDLFISLIIAGLSALLTVFYLFRIFKKN